MTGEASPRILIAGLGDTGVLVATRLARHYTVVAVSTSLALVSGQELGLRLVNPRVWKASYYVAHRRFRSLRNVTILHGRVADVDFAQRRAVIDQADGTRVEESYDVLVIATGASNGFWRSDRVVDELMIDREMERIAGRVTQAHRVAVVGAGATGVSVADNLARTGKEVHLFFRGDEPLPEYHPRARRWITRQLIRDGVTMHPGQQVATSGHDVTDITSGVIYDEDGHELISSDATIWATGTVHPHSSFLSADVLDEQGFVKVDGYLRVVGHPEVFCVGDVCASDPLRSSARNWGWRIVVSNVRRHVRHRRRLKRYRAPDFRWGSILGLQRNGLTVVQPNGRTFRIPKRIASYFLYRIFVGRYLYRGLSRD